MSEHPGEHVRPRVLLFFDYACSFCYIDLYRFRRLESDFDIEVVHVPFELRPDIPDQGVSARAEGLEHDEHVEEHLVRLARKEGVPYRSTDLIPKTHKAMVLAEAARDADLYETAHEIIFRAYFGDGRDIGDETVLLALAGEIGLDPGVVVDAWTSGRFEERIHAFYHLANDLGITATPSALICNELLIGARPYGVVRDAVQRCLVTADNVAEQAVSS